MARNRRDVSVTGYCFFFLVGFTVYTGWNDQICLLAGTHVLHALCPIFWVHYKARGQIQWGRNWHGMTATTFWMKEWTDDYKSIRHLASRHLLFGQESVHMSVSKLTENDASLHQKKLWKMVSVFAWRKRTELLISGIWPVSVIRWRESIHWSPRYTIKSSSDYRSTVNFNWLKQCSGWYRWLKNDEQEHN